MTKQPEASGAIYDIGYRHYDGPRLGRRYIWGSLLADSLRGAFGLGRSAKAKILPWLLVGFACLPAVVVALVASLTGAAEMPVTPSGYVVAIAVLLFIFVAAQAPQSVSRDLRYRTISLYFSRSLRHIDYITAKVTALTVAVFAFAAVPATIVYVGALLAKLPWRPQTGDWLLGLVTSAISAVVYAAFALAIAAWTPRRGVGVAVIVIALFVTSSASGVIYQILSGQGRESQARFAALLSPSGVIEGLAAWLTRTATAAQVNIDTTLGLSLVAGAVMLVVACYGVLVLRYRRVGIS